MIGKVSGILLALTTVSAVAACTATDSAPTTLSSSTTAAPAPAHTLRDLCGPLSDFIVGDLQV